MSECFFGASMSNVRELSEADWDEITRARRADNRFLTRFPYRQHRVRLASRAERKQFKIAGGETPPDSRYVVVCRGEGPNFYSLGPVTSDIDVAESDASSFYQTCLNEEDGLVRNNWLRRARGKGGRDG